MARFILNNQLVDTGALPQGSTVLDYVRYTKQLVGTKIGCREGDCGACTVLVGEWKDNTLRYRSMTSCLMPLGNAHGKHLLTVEGINMESGLSPAQQAMQQAHGTQCGFCTIGFVMSLTGFVLHPTQKTGSEAITAMDGNICRCTGYKSIERAADLLAESLQDKPNENTLEWLVQRGFLPEYMLGIPQRLQALQAELSEPPAAEDALVLGGGTDLMVQRPEAVKKANTQHYFDQSHLQYIRLDDNGLCRLGASTTATDFAESPLAQSIFPQLAKYMKWVSSTPIRNMATMAGNIVNASPIGDMTIFFLALDAQLLLKQGSQERSVRLRDFFKGYKQLDKTASETIAEISFVAPDKNTFFNFEKVCKREHLDIASVNSACSLRLAPDGNISQIHLSGGGVSATPKYLSATCAFLTGKKPTKPNVEAAFEVLQSEISPISDARGSAEYKRLLLQQLVIAHFISFFGEQWY